MLLRNMSMNWTSSWKLAVWLKEGKVEVVPHEKPVVTKKMKKGQRASYNAFSANTRSWSNLGMEDDSLWMILYSVEVLEELSDLVGAGVLRDGGSKFHWTSSLFQRQGEPLIILKSVLSSQDHQGVGTGADSIQ